VQTRLEHARELTVHDQEPDSRVRHLDRDHRLGNLRGQRRLRAHEHGGERLRQLEALGALPRLFATCGAAT
jgi:hypothetical protein